MTFFSTAETSSRHVFHHSGHSEDSFEVSLTDSILHCGDSQFFSGCIGLAAVTVLSSRLFCWGENSHLPQVQVPPSSLKASGFWLASLVSGTLMCLLKLGVWSPCVDSSQPRSLSPCQQQTLQACNIQVTCQLELHQFGEQSAS